MSLWKITLVASLGLSCPAWGATDTYLKCDYTEKGRMPFADKDYETKGSVIFRISGDTVERWYHYPHRFQTCVPTATCASSVGDVLIKWTMEFSGKSPQRFVTQIDRYTGKYSEIRELTADGRWLSSSSGMCTKTTNPALAQKKF